MCFSKVNTKSYSSLHYNVDERYLQVNKTKISKFKAKDHLSWYNCFLGSISKDFSKDEYEIVLNGSVYGFSVDHS